MNKDIQIAKIKAHKGLGLTDYDKEVLRVYAERYKPKQLTSSTYDEKKADQWLKPQQKKNKTKKKPKKSKEQKRREFYQKQAENLSEEQKRNAMPHEQMLLAELDRRGIDYEFQKPLVLMPNSYCSLDFYIPNKRLAVELDGAYHYTKEGMERDAIRTRRLNEQYDINVMRFSNGEVERNMDDVIREIVKYRRPKKRHNVPYK